MTKKVEKERLICPACLREVKNVIGTELRLPVLYYMGKRRFGKAWTPWDNILQVRRQRKYVHLQSFYCRFCGEPFPKEMEKEIWKYLKFRHILEKLKQT